MAIHVDKPTKVKQLLLRQPSLLPSKSNGHRIYQNRFGGTFAAAVDGHDGIELRFRVRTDAGALTDADLPLALQAAGPLPLIGKPGEVVIGVREPSRLARFAVDVASRLAPRQSALAATRSDLRSSGLDLRRDFAGRLGGSGAIAINPLDRSCASSRRVTWRGACRAWPGSRRRSRSPHCTT